MKIEILSKKEKEEIDDFLNETYGINLPRCQIIQSSRERLRIFSGDLSERELMILINTIRVETTGLYLAFVKKTDKENEKNQDFRLSFDSSVILKNATKNIIDLDEEQMKIWISGQDMDINEKIAKDPKLTYPFILLKYKNEIIGCGKLAQDKILNFVPKERRIKKF